MKKRIIGILICMLLLATAVPTVESLKNSAINSVVPSPTLSSMTMNNIEKQNLFHSDVSGIVYFEYCASIDGDTAVVGTYRGDNPYGWGGSVYIFTRINNIWRQQDRIFSPNSKDRSCFGWSVSVSGDTALIGVPAPLNADSTGYVYVFTRTGSRWTQQAKLLALDGEEWDFFGLSVSLDGDTALIGAYGDDDNGNWSGSAYVFTRTGTTWTQQAKLLASDGIEYDLFGASVSLDGNTALIGAPGDGYQRVGPGSTYVFIRSGTTWIQQAKLFDPNGEQADQFGVSVSIDGDTALIGAQQYENNREGSGVAYVFTRTGAIWSQQSQLIEPDGERWDRFGYSVAVSSDTALIGAMWNWHGDYAGSVYVFTREGTLWVQQQKLQVSGKFGDCFGTSVALDGDTALITAYRVADTYRFGSSYIFTRTGTTWVEQTRLFDLKGTDYKSKQAQREMKIPVSMNTLFYQLIEKLFQRFSNAFPILQHFWNGKI